VGQGAFFLFLFEANGPFGRKVGEGKRRKSAQSGY
jgi:hypothetical protein